MGTIAHQPLLLMSCILRTHVESQGKRRTNVQMVAPTLVSSKIQNQVEKIVKDQNSHLDALPEKHRYFLVSVCQISTPHSYT